MLMLFARERESLQTVLTWLYTNIRDVHTHTYTQSHTEISLPQNVKRKSFCKYSLQFCPRNERKMTTFKN